MLRSMATCGAVVLASADIASAGEIPFGLGYDDLFGEGSGAAPLALQASSDPLAELARLDFGLAAAAEADTDGDL
jgi:hypothetical protein